MPSKEVVGYIEKAIYEYFLNFIPMQSFENNVFLCFSSLFGF